MKISLCSIAFRNSNLSIHNIVDLASTLGYDGVEIWGNHLPKSLKELELLSKKLTQVNLSAPMISPYFDLTGDESAFKQSLDRFELYCQAAKQLSSPLIRVFTGTTGSASITKQKYQQAIKGLSFMLSVAKEYNLSLALETHPRTLVDSIEACLRLLSDVNEANLKLNLDIYHMWEVHGEPVMILDRLLPFVAHIHAKNACLPPNPNGNYPLFHDKQASQKIYGVKYLDEGQMPYHQFLSRLLELNFSGFISVEWFGSNPILAAQHEITYLHQVFSSLNLSSSKQFLDQ